MYVSKICVVHTSGKHHVIAITASNSSRVIYKIWLFLRTRGKMVLSRAYRRKPSRKSCKYVRICSTKPDNSPTSKNRSRSSKLRYNNKSSTSNSWECSSRNNRCSRLRRTTLILISMVERNLTSSSSKIRRLWGSNSSSFRKLSSRCIRHLKRTSYHNPNIISNKIIVRKFPIKVMHKQTRDGPLPLNLSRRPPPRRICRATRGTPIATTRIITATWRLKTWTKFSTIYRPRWPSPGNYTFVITWF